MLLDADRAPGTFGAPAGRIPDSRTAEMCCDDQHDVQARLDVPGHIRFVVLCARCGKVQREIGRETYAPRPQLRSSGPGASLGARARLG
jgi:hypothetical protein